ncbi:GatB/YqeY domain-containing protein [Aaosphaeria arxii CBS 175.79]|uniref:Altered inheritance of mitochondria protein 41 n=1 Tax=Aaosphaeria arxii CBS 175.79 TaxID=1450172 RepID=A0A6A5XIV7_9PLEO|nr:GatB/YqeY domain-containing protein [Aaosphaeria arxii CBS 175.79]KAF2013062.1 GatB/YqeY domain-containing protein [Aaosphaeria arxii CBS 175.79]
MSLFRSAGLRFARPSIQFTCARTFVTSPRLNSDSPVLSRLRSDLKTAMRSKDTPRLNVLRALLAEITNASKTNKPIESDVLLYGLLNKQIAGSEKSVEEFQKAKRDDLVQKEQGQIEVMKGYQEEIPQLSQEEMDRVIQEVVNKAKSDPTAFNRGAVMKAIFAEVAGKVHDSKYISEKVKELTS